MFIASYDIPTKFDKSTKKSLDALRNSLSGSGDIIDRVIDDAEERRN